MLCPACENESINTQKCTNCEWEFVNFTEEPTQEEQNQYNILLSSYRTELFWNLAVRYFDNKQYEEVIECCRISCEHQLFENPLGLMASAYLEIGNKEEALNFANMSLNINPKNEFALFVLDDLNECETITEEIKKLMPELLEQDMFETTEEFNHRINNLGYLQIGYIELLDYNADNELLKFRIDKKIDNFSKGFLKIDLNHLFEISLSRKEAKILFDFNEKIVPLVCMLTIKNINIEMIDIKIDKYSFYNIYLELSNKYILDLKNKQIQEEKKKILEDEEKQKIEEYIKNLPSTWIDKKESLEWKIKTTGKKSLGDLVRSSTSIPNDWNIPTFKQMTTLIKNLQAEQALESKAFLELIYQECEAVWVKDTYEGADRHWEQHASFIPSHRKYEYTSMHTNQYMENEKRVIRYCRRLKKSKKQIINQEKSLWDSLWN